MASMILSSFLDGFTGGSLFTRLNRPGAPTQVFADEGSTYPQEGLVASLLDGSAGPSWTADEPKADETLATTAATSRFLFDGLTGLPNRRQGEQFLSKALSDAHRNRTSVAFCLFDLEQFQEVNDLFGHRFGDDVLCEVAARLASEVRTGDMIYRLGGDEFVVILLDASEAHDLCRRIFLALELPFGDEHRSVNLMMSVGIIIFPDHAKTAEELFAAADRAIHASRVSSGTSLRNANPKSPRTQGSATPFVKH